MLSKTGGLEKPKKLTIKPCKKCPTGKRYANLTICYSCHRGREKTKRELKAKARLQRTQSSKKYQKNQWKVWHRKAWNAQSQYLRRVGANFQELVECYTCFIMIHWKEAQLGHFHHNKGDFYTKNLKIQCSQCNLYKSGNLASYATRLVQEIGLQGMVELKSYCDTKFYSLDELKSIFQEYSDKLKTLT